MLSLALILMTQVCILMWLWNEYHVRNFKCEIKGISHTHKWRRYDAGHFAVKLKFFCALRFYCECREVRNKDFAVLLMFRLQVKCKFVVRRNRGDFFQCTRSAWLLQLVYAIILCFQLVSVTTFPQQKYIT